MKTGRYQSLRGALVACLLLSCGWPLIGRADVVASWDEIAINTIAPPMGTVLPPPSTEAEQRPIYATDLATLHVAMYDAVNAIDGRYQPFAAVPHAPTRGASREAAAVSAAYHVLKGLFPGRSTFYQPAYDAFVAAAGGGLSKAKGLAVGADIAAQVLAQRANDGRMGPATYTPSGLPGDFEPTPGVPLVNPFLPYLRPFSIPSAIRFRSPGPPALTSEAYADVFNEVKEVGSMASVLRTPGQSDLARFHTEAPPTFWARNLRRFATDAQGIATNARLLAVLWVAQSDAALACFESKYHYRFWRARTAIPRAAEDGNDATAPDGGWAPFLPTPNHPEYPAAHGCAAGAAAESLRRFYGTKRLSFTIDSTVPGLLAPVRAFESTDDFVLEIVDARVFGGMHYRSSVWDGADLGRRVARWVATRDFQPARCGRRGHHHRH